MMQSPQNGASLMAQLVKNPAANSGEAKDAGLIPGSGSSPGEGNGNPLQDFCLENPTNKVWWATFYGVTKNQNNRNSLACKVPESDLVF